MIAGYTNPLPFPWDLPQTLSQAQSARYRTSHWSDSAALQPSSFRRLMAFPRLRRERCCSLLLCLFPLLFITWFYFSFAGDTVTSLGNPTALDIEKESFKNAELLRDILPESVKAPPSSKHRNLTRALISNNGICQGNVDVLIYIQSYWKNFGRRRSLRDTWAGRKIFKDINIRTIFVVGKPEVKEKDQQILINNENLKHKDILEGNFVDSYKNLTLKSILVLEWITNFCTNARFVIKADDDIYVNIFRILENIIPSMEKKIKTIACHFKPAGRSPIVRDINSKWFIPENVFPNMTTLPQFCTGYAVIMTADLIPYLHNASSSAPYISVDDVYVFGLLMQGVSNVQFIDLKGNYTLNQKNGLDMYTGSDNRDLVAISAWQEGNMEKLWVETLMKMTKWSKEHSRIGKA